jgi:glutamate N-acetyltransferase/amino-acid N-acetyltransferase
MAKKCVADGERVTKLVEVAVEGAASDIDAEKVARVVANSSLVKCSWNGNDPNWGRVIHAVGYSGARIKPEMINIYFDGICAAMHGRAADTPVSELRRAISKKNIRILIDLNIGDGKYHIYTSDLSPEYVEFNREEYAAFRMKRQPAPKPETPPANQLNPVDPPTEQGWVQKPDEEDEEE